MAILWSTGAAEQIRSGDALYRALGHATALVDGGASILLLRDDGQAEGSSTVPLAARRYYHQLGN